jgi:hypothetical protein
MLARIMVELEYGSLSILGHSLRNKIPLVGNQGESWVDSMEGWKDRRAYKPKRHIQMTLQSEEVTGDYLDRCMKTKPKVMIIKLNT